jgi:hypothetical protein
VITSTVITADKKWTGAHYLDPMFDTSVKVFNNVGVLDDRITDQWLAH